MNLKTLCLILAVVIFVIATLWRPPPTAPFNMVSAGLAFLALSFLVP